ncbi:MAG: hypothetical protein EBT37_11500, partial [Betaproteobacteria bacterium]|nr:hypothetical protein [Betaproteobacteria bacterium]
MGACVMRAWGLVFVGHGTVVVPWEASVTGKTGVTRGAIRAIAVGALAPWAIATAAIRAGAASCRGTARAIAGSAGAGGAFLFAHALQHFGAGGFGGGLHHIAAGRFACAAPDGLAAHGDGFGTLAGFGFKASNHLHFDVLLGKALDVLHKAFFVHADQVDGGAVCASAAGAADAVHIV